jgi:hypothetical protein
MGDEMAAIDDGTRRKVVTLLVAASVVIVAYWVAWFAHRSLVASTTGTPYTWFEDAFPAADGLLVIAMVVGARALVRRSPTALLWLLMGVGGGLYLFAMDVLYDLEHGIWASGTNGIVELVFNVVTLSVALFLGAWAWRHRTALLAGD